jgi:hypothetical protein
MERVSLLVFTITLLLITAPRLPAPISEEATPTPKPTAVAKPKPKPVAAPKPKPTPPSFAETWSGVTTESYFGQTSNLTIIASGRL